MQIKAQVFKRWVMRCALVPKRALKAQADVAHVPVLVTLGGQAWESTLAPHDEAHWVLVIPAAVLKASGKAVGDELRLTIEHDPGRSAPELPADFEGALAARPGMLRKFRAMTVAGQRQVVRYVEKCKSADVREKAIEVMIERLNV